MTFAISATDIEFRTSVEECSIAVPSFDHRAHLRLAYIYLVDHDTDAAADLVREALTRLLRHNGIEPSAKYHETLTKAWLLTVRHFMDTTNTCQCAEVFINKNPVLLDSKIVLTHYSEERLFSEHARREFLQPDIQPFPASGILV